MANSYTWSISGLFCYPQLEGQNNVVFNVQWAVNATDGENNISMSGTQPITYVADAILIPYEKLTKEMVIEWVHGAMGADQVEAIQAELDLKITALAKPPVINLICTCPYR